ncbi:MAG: LamG-like jellyroll fold domain-containing protein, partial [Myxococcota bacterium]
ALQTWQGGRAVSSATVANVLPAGQWVHLAATVSTAQGFGLFVDGQRVLMPSGAVLWTASSSTAWVGAEREGASGSRHRLNGAFDEFRLSRGVRNY